MIKTSSKIILGTAQFGLDYGISNNDGQVALNEIKKVLDFAYSSNIRTLDTAISYGESEKNIGLASTSNFNIISKIPKLDNIKNIDEFIRKQINNSIQKLKVESLYGLLFHDISIFKSKYGQEAYKIICQLRDEGLIRKIGISIYDTESSYEVLDKYDFDIVQAPLNIFDRRILSQEFTEYANQKNIEIHARSIFLQGLLLMNSTKRPKFFEKWNHLFTEYDNYIKEKRISRLEACIGFVCARKEVSKIIIGVQNLNQLKEIINISKSNFRSNFPEQIQSFDQKLINPSNWR